MIPLLFLALASADLDALDQAVARCDRTTANPVFAGEAGRRSQFLLDAYREQEAIVADKLRLPTSAAHCAKPARSSPPTTSCWS